MPPSYACACVPLLEMLYIVVLAVYSHFERGDMPKTATANCQRFGRIAHAVRILCACVARSSRASVDGDPRFTCCISISIYICVHPSVKSFSSLFVSLLLPPLLFVGLSHSQITVIVLPPLPGLAL